MSELTVWLELSFYLFIIFSFLPFVRLCAKFGVWIINKVDPIKSKIPVMYDIKSKDGEVIGRHVDGVDIWCKTNPNVAKGKDDA